MLWKIICVSSCGGKNKRHSIYMLSSQRKVFYALFSLQAKWCMGEFHHQIMKAGFN